MRGACVREQFAHLKPVCELVKHHRNMRAVFPDGEGSSRGFKRAQGEAAFPSPLGDSMGGAQAIITGDVCHCQGLMLRRKAGTRCCSFQVRKEPSGNVRVLCPVF